MIESKDNIIGIKLSCYSWPKFLTNWLEPLCNDLRHKVLTYAYKIQFSEKCLILRDAKWSNWEETQWLK